MLLPLLATLALTVPSFGDSKSGPVFDNWSGFYLVDANGNEFSRMIQSASYPFFQIHKPRDCNEFIVIDDWEKRKIENHMWSISSDTIAFLHFWGKTKDIALLGRYSWMEKRASFSLNWPRSQFTAAIRGLKATESLTKNPNAAIDINIVTNLGDMEWSKYESIGLPLKGFTEAYDWLTGNCGPN